MSSISVIDPEAIANLRALSPDDGDVFLKEILTLFLEDTPARMNDLRASLANQKTDLFVRSAHSIKGSAGNVGATELRAIAELMEHHGRHNGPAGTEGMMVELEAAYARTRQALQKLVAS
jgi:histidine phosphotransfer protein HptB